MAVEYINVFLMGAGGVRAPHNPSQADYLDDSNVVHLARRAVPEQLAANITSMVALQPSTNILVPIIMFSIGMVGNIVAAGVYHCSSSWHRGTAFYGILRGFFLTSIIGYLAVYPVMIAVHVNGLHWIGGPKMCDFHGFAVLTFGMSLAYITGVLGFERFLASCRPLTYNRKVEPRKIPFVLVLLWIVSVFTGILPLVGFGRIHLQYPSTWCFIDWRNDETVGRLFSSVLATIIVSVIVLVIVSIIAATIGAVYRTAKKCRGMVGAKDDDRGRYSLTLTIDDNSRRIPRRFFAADRALMWATLHYDLLASGFLVCYIPVVMRIIANVSGQPLDNFKNMSAMHWAEFYPAFCPWLYVLCHEQIWMRVTCTEPPYRDVPYPVPRSSGRRRSGTSGHDCTREANGGSGGHRDSPPTSNHVNVVMHDHIDGYAMPRRPGLDVENEPHRNHSAKKKLDFIKEDDSNHGSLPHSPVAAAPSPSPVRSVNVDDDPAESTFPSSPTSTITKPLMSSSTPKSKLTITKSYPTSNGPVSHNHVNASRTKSSGSHSGGGQPVSKGQYTRVPTQPEDGGGQPVSKGQYTRVPTQPEDGGGQPVIKGQYTRVPTQQEDSEVSPDISDAVAKRTAFAQSGRKESSI